MAIPTDNFDSYSAGDLNGNNGGSGWGGAWSGAGEFDVQTSVFQSSPNGVQIASSGSERRINRVFASGQSSGQWVSYGRIAGTNGYGDHGLNDGANTNAAQRCVVRFLNDGNIILYYSSYSAQTIQAYSANTWYKITIDFDCATDDYRVKIDNGSYTSRFAFVNGTSSTLDRVDMHKTDSAGSDWFFDSFSPANTAYDETYTETMTLVDTVLKAPSRILADVMTLVDTITTLKILSTVLTETMTLVDTITRSISRTLTDVMTLVDTIPRSISRTLSDVMTLVDTITTALTRNITLTETMTLIDSFLVNGSNVIWAKIVKSADAVWTKIVRS